MIEELSRGLRGLLVEDKENGPAVGHVTSSGGPSVEITRVNVSKLENYQG